MKISIELECDYVGDSKKENLHFLNLRISDMFDMLLSIADTKKIDPGSLVVYLGSELASLFDVAGNEFKKCCLFQRANAMGEKIYIGEYSSWEIYKDLRLAGNSVILDCNAGRVSFEIEGIV